MKLIVGLGNPGEKYQDTRHNVGFMVLEQFLKNYEPVEKTVWENSKKFKSDIVEIEWKIKKGETEKAILVKPKTYMNNSGMAVSLLSMFYKIDSRDIWVVHDELDLPLGSMKIRLGGAGAGHHGVESIIESLGTDTFWRFRLGIGISHHHDEMAKHKINNGERFVLGMFEGKQAKEARDLVKRGTQALETALEKGTTSAMNRFNTK